MKKKRLAPSQLSEPLLVWSKSSELAGTEARARRIGGIHGQMMATFAAKDKWYLKGTFF
jgi:hypothetical protein